MIRPRCSVFIAMSLDGFIAGPGDDLGFLSAVERPGEDYGYSTFIADIDVLVIGRGTYDAVAGFEEWPYTKRVVVLTSRPAQPLHGEEFFSDDVHTLLDTLASQGARRVYVDGGVTIRRFLAAGAIDDLTVSVIPVLLGAGIPLFGGVSGTVQLESTQSFESGLVQLRYRVTH